MPRFQRAALYVLTSGPTSLRGNDEFAGNVSFTGNCRIIEGLRGPDLGGTDSIRVIVADLGMDWKRVRGLCRLREGDDCWQIRWSVETRKWSCNHTRGEAVIVLNRWL
jgi:hypothetical protein